MTMFYGVMNELTGQDVTNHAPTGWDAPDYSPPDILLVSGTKTSEPLPRADMKPQLVLDDDIVETFTSRLKPPGAAASLPEGVAYVVRSNLRIEGTRVTHEALDRIRAGNRARAAYRASMNRALRAQGGRTDERKKA